MKDLIEIWRNIINIFEFIYEKIKKLIKPICFILYIFCLYECANCLAYKKIILCILNLFASIIFLELLGKED